MNTVSALPDTPRDGKKMRRERKTRELQKRGTLKTKRSSLWWRVNDLCTGGNSLRWHLTGLWAPLVISFGSRDSIFRFLKKVDKKGYLSAIFALDLAKALARYYASDYLEFDNGVVRLTNLFFLEWVYTHSTPKNQRLTVAYLGTLPALSFPMILVEHMKKQGYEFRNADNAWVRIHADAWEQRNNAANSQIDALNDPDLAAGEAPLLHGGVTLDKKRFKVRVSKRVRTWLKQLKLT